MSLISCRDLALGYAGQCIVENLTFDLNVGDYLCIVGENGSGKSTLMRTLLHLQKPISGTLQYGDGLASCEIGYLPQQTVAQKDFPASVYEVVLSGCLNKSGLRPFYSRAQKALAQEQMEKLGIMHLKKKCYRELSGGQQQRVLLARALCSSSKLILLDEPVSGLDPKVTADMYEMIAELNRSGVAVIMISHDIEAAVKYASHILHVAHKPKFFGKTEDYLKTDVGSSFAGGERS